MNECLPIGLSNVLHEITGFIEEGFQVYVALVQDGNPKIDGLGIGQRSVYDQFGGHINNQVDLKVLQDVHTSRSCTAQEEGGQDRRNTRKRSRSIRKQIIFRIINN